MSNFLLLNYNMSETQLVTTMINMINKTENQIGYYREQVQQLEKELKILKENMLQVCPHTNVKINRIFSTGMHSSEKEYICEACAMDIGCEIYFKQNRAEKN